MIATDGYTSGLLAELGGGDPAIRNQVVATESPRTALPDAALRPAGPTTGTRIPTAGSSPVGCRDADKTEYTSDEALTSAIQEALDAFVEALLGRRPRITHRWSGVFGCCPDLLPLAGPVPDREGLWAAGGYSGHGNVLGLLWRPRGRGDPGDSVPGLECFDPAGSRLEIDRARSSSSAGSSAAIATARS